MEEADGEGSKARGNRDATATLATQISNKQWVNFDQTKPPKLGLYGNKPVYRVTFITKGLFASCSDENRNVMVKASNVGLPYSFV